jgi:uncharacterized membrane protein
MATTTAQAALPKAKPNLAPTLYDRFLALASTALLAAILIALWKGRGEWVHVPAFVWAHLVTIILAVALTPLMMLRRRGDRLHRRLGWIWSASILLTAAFTFGIRGINSGALSLIHILSAWTLLQVPMIVIFARRHDHAKHRNAVRGVVTGGLVIAGFFTFPFGRMLGQWLFG